MKKTMITAVLMSFMFVFATCKTGSSSNVDHGWLTNYEDALQLAKKEKKGVLLLFTGSDWCPPCKRLHHDVFDSEGFKEFAKKNLILVELDFPRKRENKLPAEQQNYNRALSRKFKVRGFPTVVILDADGKELGRWVGYRPTELENTLDEYAKALKLK